MTTMTTAQIAAYNAGTASGSKMLPTYYTGDFAAAWKIGKFEAISDLRELTAEEAAWLKIHKARFV